MWWIIKRVLTAMGVVFAGFVLLIGLFGKEVDPAKVPVPGASPEPAAVEPAVPEKTPAELRNTARFACKSFTKPRLNDPDSAEFEPHRTFPIEERPDKVYEVVVQLRARNAFNALMYGEFDCTVALRPEGWVLLSLEQRGL
jgi:hypothetical protein